MVLRFALAYLWTTSRAAREPFDDLWSALGQIRKPILLKRGMSATVVDLLMSAEYVLSQGNPHVVLQVTDTNTTPVEDLGEMLESHPRFPNRVNVGFMQKIDAHHIRLRVFERGVGETHACGTGACAAVAWGILAGALESEVEVQLPGGTLVVSWRGRGTPLFLTGPTDSVFEGTISV